MNPPLVVGNWKMHGTPSEASSLARHIRKGTTGIKKVDVVLAPPFTALTKVHEILRGSKIQLAGQNLHWQTEGAFTGEISPKMLRDSGCRFVIIGHSERRHLFYEGDQDVAKKIVASLQAGLGPILCVGETLQERRKGSTARVSTTASRRGYGHPAFRPPSRRMARPAKKSYAHKQETGFPGSRNTSVPPSSPMPAGLDGRMATP